MGIRFFKVCPKLNYKVTITKENYYSKNTILAISEMSH